MFNNKEGWDMLYILCVLTGAMLGAAVAWLVVSSRGRAQSAVSLADTEKRCSAAEGSLIELRSHVQKTAAEYEKLLAAWATEREGRTVAETRLKEMMQRLEEEKKLLDEAKQKLTDTFKALAGDTLQNSNKAFLELAKGTFEKILAESKGDLGKREEAILGLVRPLSESLKQFDEHVRGLEKTRQEAYTGLETQLKTLVTSQQQLQKETGNLVTALRAPQVRGRWGEITLKRVVELAGMSDHCDFSEQVSVDTTDGRKRPDLIVRLPSEREIVVDAKVALDAYLNALAAETEDQRQGFLVEHARQTRTHMAALGAKAYWQQFEKAPEFVVMFIPGESFFAAAVDQDHQLIEDGMQARVILATPTTLIALLRAVAYGWRQEKIAENAQKISDLGKELYDRMSILVKHISGIGAGLKNATMNYNDAVGSMERMLLPAARRFRDLGAASGKDISILAEISVTPNSVKAPELAEGHL